MNEIIIQEQKSFGNKMENISQTNALLDDLQRKMNSYFKQTHPQPPDHQQSSQNFKFYSQNQDQLSQTTLHNKIKLKNDFRLFGKARSKNQSRPNLIEEQYQQREEEKDDELAKQENAFLNFGIKEHLESEKKKNSNNSLVREMETMELLMKEKILGKQRRMKQLQQQIVTQNQERVYLYKVNVRLEEEFKLLSEAPSHDSNSQWQIHRMTEQLEKLQKQLDKKKKERKQLRREQQTLKEGYRTLVQNRRNLALGDIQKYKKSQKDVEESEGVLRNLIQQLDKLKGVVESRIKSTGKRKVIKSYKN